MRKIILLVMVSLFMHPLFAQDTTSTTDSIPKYWTIDGGVSLILNQVGMYRWQGGGEPSFSATLLYKGNFNYAKEKQSWENYIDIAYGSIKQGKNDQTKSDDRWEIGSKYGRQINDKWDANVFGVLRSQFVEGFDPDITTFKISNMMSPGYLLAGIGINYKKGDWLNVNLSPLTNKTTFVLDTAIANIDIDGKGKYGNDVGSTTRAELGLYAKITIKKEILENVFISTKADFFTDYLNNFGAIDVNWNLLLLMKVNKFITATVTMDLLYDEDILIVLEKNNQGQPIHIGPAVQLKETIGIGLTYTY